VPDCRKGSFSAGQNVAVISLDEFAGDSAGAVALAGFSGSVTAGGDGVILSEGNVNASLSAGKDAFVLAYGNVNGGYSSGRDAAVVTYSDFNAGLSADRDVAYVLAGGDISGPISADRSIGQHHNFLNTFHAATDSIFAYGAINASISALNTSGSPGGGMIAGVGAGGPISGTITAGWPGHFMAGSRSDRMPHLQYAAVLSVPCWK
jgi:hypothetical protein